MGGSRGALTIVDGGVEAGDGGGEILVQDIGNVGTGIEGLVLRRVKIGSVDDLQSRVAASRHGVGRVGNADACVTLGQLLKAG